MKLDLADLRLARVWQDNPEASVADLAELAGMSKTPCWRRMQKLQGSGAVTGRALLLDPASFDLVVEVFAHLRLDHHDEATLNALEAAAIECPNIVECYSMSGDADYLLRITTTGIEAYERLLKQTLLHLPGVAGINSSFALKRIKMTTRLPL